MRNRLKHTGEWLLLFCLCLFTFGGKADDKEKQIVFTDHDGLPRNIVTCFVKDKYGYGWIGTGNGIARFDGYSFKQNDQLRGKFINTLLFSDQSGLWVGTDDGLFLYDYIHDSFSLIQEGYVRQLTEFHGKIFFMLVNRLLNVDQNHTLTSMEIPQINSYCVTEDGIWYGSGNNGLQLLNEDTRYVPGMNLSLIKGIDDDLWLAGRNGQLYIRDKKRLVSEVRLNNHYPITCMEKIGDEVWISTDGNGIFVLNNQRNIIRKINKFSEHRGSFPSNSIYHLFGKDKNEIWISTYGAGLVCLLPGNSPFKNIVPGLNAGNSLIAREGTAVWTFGSHFLLGTNYGMSIYNYAREEFRNFSQQELMGKIRGNKVLAFQTTPGPGSPGASIGNQFLWIATYDGLLGKFNDSFEMVKSYHPCTDNPDEMQRIVLLFNHKNSKLLIGTQFQGKSLISMDLKNESLKTIHLPLRGQDRTNFQINSIRENRYGRTIVLVRNAGIFQYDEKSDYLENIVPEINSRITFRLNDFYHDKESNYWFATQADGLIRMSTDGKVIDGWTVNNGFPTNTLLRLESVNDTDLWISSIAGLCRFNRYTKGIQIFNYRHGLASNEFTPRTSLNTDNKQLVFGNTEGFVFVEPEYVIPDTSRSDVIISDIVFQNQSIKNLSHEKYLSTPLEESVEVKLPFRRNSFTIHFFSRDKDLPKFCNYAYRLTDLENDWIYLGENNHTTYTNLSPGQYTFQVKATNKGNIWNEKPTSLSIRILPPWYLTWYAFTLYFLLSAGTFIFLFRMYSKRVQLKKEIEISEFKILKEHELTEKKLEFFTNISHDLKTPLTLISAPVNDLIRSENLDAGQLHKLNVIRRNAERLCHLIADLIDFRKITQNQLPLRVRKTDPALLLNNIFDSFSEEACRKAIDFNFHCDLQGPLCLDPDIVEKIIWNLMSNALKFTPEGGKITLFAEKTGIGNIPYLQIIVSDTGKGITPEQKEKIFDTYYQVQETSSIRIEGSGIGLSIVRDLAEIHHGKVELESDPGRGSTFKVILPAGESFFTDKEKLGEEAPENIFRSVRDPAIDRDVPGITRDEVPPRRYNLPHLLIVEDNEELRRYLSGHFRESFQVSEASDGAEGLFLAVEKEPDLIISDVLMPHLNGYEFCRKIRENFNTSHIPVVLLTANTSTEQKVEGLASGADVYISKPFEISYLDAVLKSLLQNRKRSLERFIGIEPVKEDEKLSPTDVRFLNTLKDFILSNIDNPEINIDVLSNHLAVSRVQLNRKVKALTGQTPNNFIKLMRLKKAYELIRHLGIRVSDAAFMTGFSDPNYFTLCFKKEFGENPSRIS